MKSHGSTTNFLYKIDCQDYISNCDYSYPQKKGKIVNSLELVDFKNRHLTRWSHFSYVTNSKRKSSAQTTSRRKIFAWSCKVAMKRQASILRDKRRKGIYGWSKYKGKSKWSRILANFIEITTESSRKEREINQATR